MVNYLQIITYYSLSAFTECLCNKSKQGKEMTIYYSVNTVQRVSCLGGGFTLVLVFAFLKAHFFSFAS